MYTYDSFETLGVFTLLRPVFITLLIISFLLFIVVLVPSTRDKIVNGYTVASISIISLIVSTQLLYYDAIIVDELGLGGDEVTTGMFGVIAALNIVNPTIYFAKRGD